jgi:hypothetical protein
MVAGTSTAASSYELWMGALQRMLLRRKPSYHANGDTTAPLAMVAGGAGLRNPGSHIF